MKVVALANAAHALAHVSRLLEISKILRSHGHEITFAGRRKSASCQPGWLQYPRVALHFSRTNRQGSADPEAVGVIPACRT
jgi:UDP:flavonoid glycosyltransferase YjiC (YdhE family)